MSDSDDCRHASVLGLALTVNTGLTENLLGTLLAKGVISPREHRQILDHAAGSLETALGPAAPDDDDLTKALRAHLQQLRAYGPQLDI